MLDIQREHMDRRTADINNSTASDVPLGGAVEDALYIGCARQFAGITWDVGTAPTGGVAVWEYWNGSTWATLTTAGNGTLPVDNGTTYFDPPSNWATTQVNSEVDGPRYYIRMRVTTVRTTAGALNAAHLAVCLNLAAARTINLPETTSRTIRHATLRVWMGATFSAIDHIACKARWGSDAFADVATKQTTTNANSLGESTALLFDLNWDAATQTAWASGTSKTCDAWIAFHGRGNAVDTTARASAWAELLITYEYDDSSATQLNTLVLPIDSLTGAATTSLQTVGGASAWPQLTGAGGVIKEASPVIRDVYAVIVANTNESGTTDYEVRAALDAEGDVLLFYGDAVNNSDYLLHLPWRRTDAATGSAHDLKVRVTTVTGATLEHVGAYVVVTYEYDDATTTTLTQTDCIPVQLNTSYGPGTGVNQQEISSFTHWIEAASPSLIRAGSVLYTYQTADPGNLLFSWGSQTARTYTVPEADTAGPIPFVQRLDSGGVAGSGITFGRGKITGTATFRYDTSGFSAGGIGGMVYLTYSYTKESGKRQSCAMFSVQRPSSLSNNVRSGSTLQISIPETSWFMGSCGLEQFDNSVDAQTTSRVRVQRGTALGWFTTSGSFLNMDGFRGARISSYDFGNTFVRYSGDPYSSRLNPVSAALSTSQDGPSSIMSVQAWVCWHDYTWSVAGNVAGSAGGTVNLSLHDAATTELLKTATRSGDGSYSFTWHDNTREVYVVAREDGTHLGRSDNGLAA